MASRVMVINPSGEEELGVLDGVLREAGAAVDELAAQEVVDLLVSGPPSRSARVVPSLPRTSKDHDCLIVLGSPLGVLTSPPEDPEENRQTPPRIAAQIEALIRDFHAAEKPVLGICLGAQLVARAFGGAVRQLPSDEAHTALPVPLKGQESPPLGTEFGWHAQEFSAAAEADDVIGPALRATRSGGASRGSSGPALKFQQWHSDFFDVPEGAVPLSTRSTCPNQAFRVGRRTYAFQYHIEVGRELAEQWFSDYAEGVDSFEEKSAWVPLRGEGDREALRGKLLENVAEGSVERAEEFTRSIMRGLLVQAQLARGGGAVHAHSWVAAAAVTAVAVVAVAAWWPRRRR